MGSARDVVDGIEFITFEVLLLAFWISLLVFAGFWAFRKPLLTVSSAPADAVLRDVAFRLRAAGYTVDASKSPLRVKVGSLTAIKIHVRSGPSGTEVRYEVDATPVGWGLVFILVSTGYTGIVGIAVAIAIDVTASRFARLRLAALLGHAPLGTLPPKTVRSLLVEGFSEAKRLASEALDYEREAAQNTVGMVLLGVIVLWVAVFFGIGIGLSSLLQDALLVGLLLATASSAGAGAIGTWAVRRRAAPMLRRLRADVALYSGALVVETAGTAAGGSARGGLELLLQAAERSSFWREIRRRRKLIHDPVSSLTIFLFAYGVFITSVIAIALDIVPLWIRVALGALAAVFTVGMGWSIRSELRELREEDRTDRLEWERRRRDIETELWKLLSG